MKSCGFQEKVERWFDGELAETSALEGHIAECPRCVAHLEGLERLRGGVESVRERVEITDGQLPGFLKGIEDEIGSPRGRRLGLWAMASAAAAAVVVAVSLISTFSGGPPPLAATTVFEDISTDIDGATTESYVLEDGTPTLWINVPEGDMW